MPYDSITNRTDSQALIPEAVSNIMLEELTAASAALTLFRSIPMSTAQTRFPVLSALPTAYFVAGDTGLKQTTEVAWDNKYINVEELAVIVPVPEAVLDDVSFDMWGAIRPMVVTAIGRALDAAIFFGTNKPASWPDAIAPDAIAKGNELDRGTNAAAAGGLAQDFSDLFALVEEDGFDVDGVIASTKLRARLRSIRAATTGDSIDDDFIGQVRGMVQYPMRGMWPAETTGNVEVIAGDFTQGIIGRRQDFTFKVLDQAVITDNTGAIIYNLAQQDMVALRVVARFGFQLANTLNWDNSNDATRYPFAVLRTP